MISKKVQSEKQKLMSRYNLYPADDFTKLVQRDPREILNLMLEVAESSRQHPDSAYLVPYTSIPTDCTTVTPEQFGWLFVGENHPRQHDLPSMEIVGKRIGALMPFSDQLSWDGYVAAGSFAALVCQPLDNPQEPTRLTHNPHDVDFYPHCKAENRGNLFIHEAAMLGYRQFLDDMTAVINDSEDSIFAGSMTKRNANCTTIAVEVNHGQPMAWRVLQEYQIIHRAHTSPTSVIVGFDQMACKALYDGKMVYFTLDAALCLYFGINPVDWRRESPSHMRRVKKYYEYGYTPIFPGLKLDLREQLVTERSDENNMYYLPGCLLLAHQAQTTTTSKKYTSYPVTVRETNKSYPVVEMFLEHYGLNLYCKRKRDPAEAAVELQHYQRTELSNIEKRCLNIADVPLVPFSKEAQESDYSAETTSAMAQAYHVLSMVIKDKFTLLSLYNEEAPNQIIDNGKGIDVRSVLRRLLVGSRSQFYFGTDRVYNIQRQMSRMLLTNHSRIIGVKLLNKAVLDEVAALQTELRQIFEARVTELEELLQPQISKLQAGVSFITSNPGAQFTASFKPIIRSKPEEYWGRFYAPTKPSRLRQLKLTLLCIRKYHLTTLSYLDKNIMKMLFSYLDMAYFRQDDVKLQEIAKPQPVVHEVPAASSTLTLNHLLIQMK